MKVPFFRLSFGREEKTQILESLDSGWVTSGPKVREFEKLIAKLSGAKHACALSSGTAGLLLTLKAAGIGKGYEVITTPNTMIATIESIIHAGAKPVLADIDPISLNVDPVKVERAISKKTKAVIAVDIAGVPCDYKVLKSICRKSKLLLVSDAAHSLGASYNGKPVGSLADATAYSFYPTKNITTGEGGMAVSDKKRLIDKIRHLSLHAMTSSGYKRYKGGSWKYDITDLGYKYNMTDLSAALGLGQLTRFGSLQKERKELAQKYMSRLNSLQDYIELPHITEEVDSSWHLFMIKLNLDRLKITRDRFIVELEEKGIGCGVHFIPVYHFSYYKKMFGGRSKNMSNCEASFKRVVSLPLYSGLKRIELDYVCQMIELIVRKYSK